MNFFQAVAERLPEYRELMRRIRDESPSPRAVTGLSRVHKAHFIAALSYETRGTPLLVLTETENEAMRLRDDIDAFLRVGGANGGAAAVYPAKDLNLIRAGAVSPEYEHRRLAILSELSREDCCLSVVVASPEAAAQTTVSPGEMRESIIRVKKGGDINRETLLKRLVDNGYSRRDMTEGVSQFSARGSIIDIFPVNGDAPVRIDLWGDTAEKITRFDIETQRSVGEINEAYIPPAAEFSAGAALFDYVERVAVCESVNCAEQFRAAEARLRDDIEAALAALKEDGGDVGVLRKKYMLSKSEYESAVEKRAAAYFGAFSRNAASVNANALQLPSWNGEYGQLKEDLAAYIKNNYSAVIFAGTEKAARSLAFDLREDGFIADYSENPKKIFAKHIYVIRGTLSAGYDYPSEKLAAITHTGVSGKTGRVAEQTYRLRAKKKKKSEEIRSLTEINAGDYVVHDNYGIGIFEGVTKLTSEKVSKDYIKIRYAGKDALYVPVTQLDFIARYIGNADAANIRLSKLRTDSWRNAKAKAKKAAAELAEELIELYSKRMRSKGRAFAPDTREQEEFENRFSYVETEDQLVCVGEIKRDMQKERPMDRLLCGDVGFGKTEVALRGAFKCVMEGAQCALLCPTTVLAWQHYRTALQRMEGFPVNIELLSRFRSAKEQKRILEKLESGVIDFVIGTHRLVGKDVRFKNLGLVIIDEEQRFGVSQKEKLKEAFVGTDVLTLSATPIPRTLNMAMSGIRDMSVIETPPHDRMPVTTYVAEYDEGVVAGAINKELRRAGQVYYVHNRVESIASRAAKISELCPEAVIGVAHGKMNEDELLKVWRRLLDREIDVLVCTTLIETGVDVPNVNTLIVENADRMGLAQLHQLRGRVGRTNRRAYAYFTFKQGKVLTEIAEKRLNAIREFTRFGAGFKIALRDLEIRGAGSVLGESQSGHMSAVGYETYVKLLKEAVDELTDGASGGGGGAPTVPAGCVVDVKADAYIPESYISNQAQRISCYKKIAEIRDEESALDVIDELTDRYGEIPKPAKGLIDAARVRNMAAALGISEVTQEGDVLMFYRDENRPMTQDDIHRVFGASETFGERVALNLTGRTGLSLKTVKGEGVMEAAVKLLRLLHNPLKSKP
ncbi:MAG: transcription-repair coupling factor [Oscillospiraceae bacterium]|jgi:transcription-repair coupling factor (superfamily II helicase)|nr:transcription-repair coupling factor [Oscillospiraceae bacterium]